FINKGTNGRQMARHRRRTRAGGAVVARRRPDRGCTGRFERRCVRPRRTGGLSRISLSYHPTRSNVMNQPKRIIAVVGATGAQGGGLVRALLSDRNGPFIVRALTRDVHSEKARALARLGAEVVA